VGNPTDQRELVRRKDLRPEDPGCPAASALRKSLVSDPFKTLGVRHRKDVYEELEGM
jgi:hypothetical protein